MSERKKLEARAVLLYLLLMKTTIDLPEDLLKRAKIAAAESGSTVKNLVISGLETVLAANGASSADSSKNALKRLKTGFHLGGKPLTRDECHAH
jgi:hypothetical protein